MLAGVVLRELNGVPTSPRYRLWIGPYFGDNGAGAWATGVCSDIHCPPLLKCPTLKALYCPNFPGMFSLTFASLTTLMLHLVGAYLISRLAHVIRSFRGFTSGRWGAWRRWIGWAGLRRNSNGRHEGSDAAGNSYDGTEGIDPQ